MDAIKTNQKDLFHICFLGLGLGSVIVDMVGRELYFRQKLAEITLIDGDLFSPKKASHEAFTQIGPKVKVKAKDLKRIFPQLKVKTVYKELWSKNAKKLLDPQDMVIAFTDVNNMSYFLSEYFSERERGILITGGVYADDNGGFMRVYVRDNFVTNIVFFELQ